MDGLRPITAHYVTQRGRHTQRAVEAISLIMEANKFLPVISKLVQKIFNIQP
jgi:hypothetical protein